MNSASRKWTRWLGAAAGLASLVWFLARVIPKPSRAAYPCQRAAAPLAGGFIVWIAGLAGLKALSRGAAATGLLALAVLAVWLPLGAPCDVCAEEVFQPSEGPNHPMGEGKGIHPGRVVWIRDSAAAHWDGKTGEW